MRAFVFAICFFSAVGVWAADQPRVLFLSKSAGFQHGTITRKDGELSHTETVLQRMLVGKVSSLTVTKDASQINSVNLQDYDVVIFYTTMDLDSPGERPEETPMSPTGQQELMDWIKAGGGFIGYHCATDTFHEKDGKITPYIDMLGGEFQTHGSQFRGTVKVVDPKHPTMKPIPGEWSMLDEWYVFKNLNTKKMHVMALLDPGRAREKQKQKYGIPDYPVIWCSENGKGRVYYNAMGHREDVWDNETFQESVWEAIRWASGEGPTAATPNYADVVPTK